MADTEETKENTAIEIQRDDNTSNEIMNKQSSSQEEEECAVLMWHIFGGGAVMYILWWLFFILGTVTILPASHSIRLPKLLPVLANPRRNYHVGVNKRLTTFQKVSRCSWAFTFGLILGIIHFIFMLLTLPLSFCGVSWSSYHFNAMQCAFNPGEKRIIDKTVEKFNFYSTAEEVANFSGVDLRGKVVIVTGCNTGIGKETARVLYGAGCIVVMACRNLEKANKAKDDILVEMGMENQANLIIIRLDLGDLKTIDEFVEEYNSNEVVDGKLDFLIANAGVMAFPEFGTTKDGMERQFGINHMGHFYLTNKLLPIIKANKTRIINVSSDMHWWVGGAYVMRQFLGGDPAKDKGPTPDQIPYDPQIYYHISKTPQVLFTRQLNKLYNSEGIVSVALMPGLVQTELGRNMKIQCGDMVDYIKTMCNFTVCCNQCPRSVAPPQGAATSLRCVVASNEEIFNGTDLSAIDRMTIYWDNAHARNDRLHVDYQNGGNDDLDQILWDYSNQIIESIDYLQLNEW